MTAPDPLIPADIDLSGNDWFPLYFIRLQESRWWRRASDLARSRNVDLWGASYRQVPAGSLPDDDIELADFAGYGRDVVGFAKVKAEIMGPWVLCSDGRWYHPTMCEVALETWERTSEKRKQAATRKRNQRSRTRPGQSPVTLKNGDVTRDEVKTVATELAMSRVTDPDVTRDGRVFAPPVTLKNGDVTRFSAVQDNTTTVPKKERLDLSKEAWERGVALLQRNGNMAEAKARSFFGGLLGQGVKAPDLLTAIVRAEVEQTHDPKAYLAGAAKRIRSDAGNAIGSSAPADPTGWDDETWETAFELWTTEQSWSPSMGPTPGQPGCRIPAHIVRRIAEEQQGLA